MKYGAGSVRRAHLLTAFTAQRIGEIAGARWDEFDLQAGTWSIPRARMKRKDAQRDPHIVPLSPICLPCCASGAVPTATRRPTQHPRRKVSGQLRAKP